MKNTNTAAEICAHYALRAGNDIADAVYRIPHQERARKCTSALKPEAKDRSKYADAKGEEIALKHFSELSDKLVMPVVCIVDPSNQKVMNVGNKSGNSVIYAYSDPIDGTVTVAGLGGTNHQANTGNWGAGFAFTEPTEKTIDDLTVGDFTTATITTGNPRKIKPSPSTVYSVLLDGSLKTVEASSDLQVYTSSQKKLGQSFVFYDAFQAFDRNTRKQGDEELAVNLYKYLINRNEGGAFDLKRDYGSLSALPDTLLGWRDCNLPESQGGAFICINENLNNLLPSVPIVLGAGGIATDFEGRPLAERKLTEGRCNVVYAANPAIHEQVMACIEKAKKDSI